MKMSVKYILSARKNVCKIFLAFVFLISGLTLAKANDSYIIPDFAFPKTVEAESESSLQKYLEEGNGLLALRSAMNLCVARNIEGELTSLQQNIDLLEDLSKKLQNPYRSLAFILEANMLNQAYSMSPEIYDKRQIPLDEIPDDPFEWSADIFKGKIFNLVDYASLDINLYLSTPISEISLILEDSKTAQAIGMSLADFLAFKASAILKNFAQADNSSIIPFYPEQEKESFSSKCRDKSLSLLQNIIDSSGDNSVLKALAIERYKDYLPDDKKESYINEAIETLRGTEGEGVLLYEDWTYFGRAENRRYAEMAAWLKKFPQGYGNQEIKSAISLMQTQKIEISFPQIALPNKLIQGQVTISNLEKGFILVYKVNENEVNEYDALNLKRFNPSGRLCQTVEIEIPKGKESSTSQPFSTTIESSIPGLSEGLYVLIPSKSKKLDKEWKNDSFYSTLRISDISIFSTSQSNIKGSGRIYVVSAVNQQPIKGAKIKYYKNYNGNDSGVIFTNEDGWAAMPEGYFRVEASYGKSIAKNDFGFSYFQNHESISNHASILTDLAIYRPGDTVRYAVIGWKQDKIENRLLTNCPIEISLRDTNYQIVAKDTLKLNSDGRAWGWFEIPKGRLLGNYSLTASFPEFNSPEGGTVNFSVEEYKLPSFNVVLSQEKASEPGWLKFNGIAKTFSGMPVSNAIVALNVEYIPWRWWGFPSPGASYKTELETDSEGSFAIELPIENLEGTKFATGRFSITAEVTSQAGETAASLPLFFNLGQALDLRPNVPDKIQINSDTIALQVPVYDMSGLPVKEIIDYKLINLNDSSLSFSGSGFSPRLKLPASSVPSGRYSLQFKTALSDWTSTETTFWRESDSVTPFPTPLWVPKNEYVYSGSEKTVNVSFGSFWDGWLLYTLSDGENIIDSKWIHDNGGLVKLSVDIPKNSPHLFITLSGLHDFEFKTESIKLVPQSSLEKMTIVSQSFRENISAGDFEEWSFKVKTGDNLSPNANVFAVMTDLALNSLKDFKWNLNIWSPAIYSKFRLSAFHYGYSNSYKTFTKPILGSSTNLLNFIPSWQTYGYPLVSMSAMRVEGPILFRSMATKNAMADFAAGTAVEASAEVADAEVSPMNEPSVELRPVEMPVAFFMPDLKTNEEGVTEIKFKVPNFNTTWQLQIASYNDNLQNATSVLEAVASKPVMVKTNLPQFLRTGDKAQLSATLFNNSDSRIDLSGKIEIINSSDGTPLAQKDYAATSVDPSGNVVVTIDFDVPYDASLLTVRAFASGDSHTDGEQGFISIFPSTTPVTEASTFYASSSTEEIIVKTPKLKTDANVTLKYCDNPLWEVLLSLPQFKESTDKSSLSIAKWLYATLISADIFKRNPNLANDLKEILETQEHLSPLNQNESLKIVAQEASPWLNNAASEETRIRSLSGYLDEENISALTEMKVQALEALHHPDGGYGWMPGMKSSPYVSLEIIKVLAYLNQTVGLNANLQNQARKAVKYYDRWLLESLDKKTRMNLPSMMDYLYFRSLLATDSPSAIKKIETQCRDSIVKNWKMWTPGQKAQAALFLQKYDKSIYQQTADTICESLKQFLTARMPLSQRGWMLAIFDKSRGGDSQSAEKIKEQIYLAKETQEWSGDIANLSLINDLLQSVPDNVAIKPIPQIYIGSDLIPLPANQSITGSYIFNLEASQVSGKAILIKRTPGIPAWGGLVSQYVSPIKEVKAADVDNLQIEKSVFLLDSQGNAKKATEFKEGDKIEILLNITCLKDMDYVVINDSRAACLQPDNSVSGMTSVDGILAYREVKSSETNFFIERLPAGKYVISYTCHADRAGEYSLGIASAQSLYSPTQVAHSAGTLIKVK